MMQCAFCIHIAQIAYGTTARNPLGSVNLTKSNSQISTQKGEGLQAIASFFINNESSAPYTLEYLGHHRSTLCDR
jgi:hypothetical protein